MLFDYPRSRHKQEIFIALYLILYSTFLTYNFLGTTMFKIPYIETSELIMFELALIIIGIKIMLIDGHSKKETLLFIFLTVSFLGAVVYTGYGFLAIPLLFILGAKNVPFKKTIQLFCIITGSLLLITILASQLGLVENLVYTRGAHTRISFGFIYPTDFTAHIFYLVMGYCYLRKEDLTYPELAVILGLSVFSLVFCYAKTNAVCLLLTFIVFLYLKVRSGDRYNDATISKCSKVLVFSMPICAAMIIGLTLLYYYLPINSFSITFNHLLNNRPMLGSIGLERYGIHLFGSAFQMVGFGGSTVSRVDYFFLDSSYVLMLIRYGIMVFASVITIFVLSSWRAAKQKDYTLLWILALISLQCVMEHHLLEIAYNPFLLLVFANTFGQCKAGFIKD